MSDKDQFTFEDDDDFQETDLSDAFSDSEHEAEHSDPEIQEEFEPVEDVKKSKKVKTTDGAGSRTRMLLLVLLVVVGGAAGVYYFMDLGGTTPSVPTVPVPAKQEVAVPEKSAPEPARVKEESSKPVQVAVPPPPKPVQKPAAEEPVQKAATAREKDNAGASEPVVKQPQEKPQPVATADESAAQKPASAAAPAVDDQTVQAEAAENQAVTSAPAPEKSQQKSAEDLAAKPVVTPKQVADGAFALDAGSYLFESNRNALIEKIKKLGYEPLVTPVDATLDMTRLRIGTFTKDEVKDALEFARSIESGAYSTPAGDKYVIYAGTYLSKGNINKLTKRFSDMGIKVYPEPVQVVRTLSRIRFGSFASREDAIAAAAAAGEKGVKAVVVKSR